ncbi:hypothetical protein [Rheinheimera metallidurans]|uniref:hypothetical protein n=1 Tax=Rheinheimera metallidurans TaxID=2925781 RepID=UPI0030022739
MSYKTEFGPDFDLGFNLSDYPQLTDKSWHNDVCPSFWFKRDRQYFVLWVDFDSPDKRESESKRYTITTAKNFSCEEHPEIGLSDKSNCLFESEQLRELVIFMEYFKKDNSS